MRKTRAFSLIEVLVVVSIIALLVSITMPTFRAARRVSRKTACMKNLATIGIGIQAYLQTNRDTFPWVCALPTYEHIAAQNAAPPRKPWVPLPVAIKSEMAGKSAVYLCPSDENTLHREPDPGGYLIPTARYYENEGLSYEWQTRLNGLKLSSKEMPYVDGIFLRQVKYPMLQDYEAFHGGGSMKGSLNTLYVDLHVASK